MPPARRRWTSNFTALKTRWTEMRSRFAAVKYRQAGAEKAVVAPAAKRRRDPERESRMETKLDQAEAEKAK